jgi:RNA polymerase sigma factor (sigma-70 family)
MSVTAATPILSDDGPSSRAHVNRNQLERELERLHSDSYGWALSCCGRDPEDAADTLQAAYAKVLSGSAHFSGTSSFKTWLFGVIRWTAHEERRRAQRLRRTRVAYEVVSVDALTAAESEVDTEQVELTRHLAVALERLPARQREVLDLVFYHQMSIAAAADVMGIGVGTARTHYERGKHRLLDELLMEKASNESK